MEEMLTVITVCDLISVTETMQEVKGERGGVSM